MKNILGISLVTLSFIVLSGCSILGADDSLAKSRGASKITKISEISVDNLKPTAKINLKQNRNDQLVATIYTNYNSNPEGSIKLQWEAPVKTSCYNTSFPITKYSEKNDKTWASVETKQGNNSCKGNWTVNVIFDKEVIATDTILVT